jgi:6-phosphofructokinase 1
MAAAPRGKLLVLQSGGPTAVINRSLVGIVREAAGRNAFSGILGAVHGFVGVLEERFVDLGRQSPSRLSLVARTPGAALGSARRKLDPVQERQALDALHRHGVTTVVGIGGNDSAENLLRIEAAARDSGRDLSVVAVPKTVDNDLPETDHCPGYGSAARFVALATMSSARDAEALAYDAPITVIEVMGRNAGWLAAAAALARREERDAPHLVCVPELAVDEDRFVEAIQGAVARWGFAVAVVGENVRGPKGPLGGGTPDRVDEFGHPYHLSPARHLGRLTECRLGVRVRVEAPGTIQRTMTVSQVDAAEAETAGRAAVVAALGGESGKMVTLVRESGSPYRCSTGLAPLALVAGKERYLPKSFMDAAAGLPTEAFLEYARPLIGGPLPRFTRLRGA